MHESTLSAIFPTEPLAVRPRRCEGVRASVRFSKGAAVFNSLTPWRHKRIARSTTIASVAVAASATLALAGGAVAHDYRPVPPPPTNPTSADQIQNIGQVSSAIKAYYGDTLMTDSNGTQVYDPVTTDGKDVPLLTVISEIGRAHV